MEYYPGGNSDYDHDKISIKGDFSVNLLNYESHNQTNDFINVSMVSHYLLPYILHPAHVTDHSATVTDNIFLLIPLIKLLVGTLLHRSLIIFHSLLFLTKLLLITNHAHIQNVTFQILLNRNLLLFSSQSCGLLHDPSVSIDSKFDQFYLSLSSYVDRHAPVKKMNKKVV